MREGTIPRTEGFAVTTTADGGSGEQQRSTSGGGESPIAAAVRASRYSHEDIQLLLVVVNTVAIAALVYSEVSS